MPLCTRQQTDNYHASFADNKGAFYALVDAQGMCIWSSCLLIIPLVFIFPFVHALDTVSALPAAHLCIRQRTDDYHPSFKEDECVFCVFSCMQLMLEARGSHPARTCSSVRTGTSSYEDGAHDNRKLSPKFPI